ncbi:MAG TPA: hypothetical protein VFL85_01575 [Candidatus Saccharimonadales bacterium]|nr:hypothetical protein [Candidatus Saccharimonadales bacterium]
MVTIEAKGAINGHLITWLFDGINELEARRNARRSFHKKGLAFISYVLA